MIHSDVTNPQNNMAPNAQLSSLAFLEDVQNADSWAEACAKFAAFLDHPEPVKINVVRRALEDEQFRHYLLTSRGNTRILNYLLNDPKNQNWNLKEGPATQSSIALAMKASSSLMEWGRAGFARAVDEVFQSRRAACLSCPHLTDPPETLAYHLAKRGGDQRICGSCGCLALRKARLSTEACPEPHPEKSGLSRWSEPMKPSKKRP